MMGPWVEWLLQRDALKAAREAPALSSAAKERLALAWATAKLADYVANGSDPLFDIGKRLTRSASAELAIRLYRDAVRWALSDAATTEEPFASVLARAPRAVLLTAAGSEATLKELESNLLGGELPRIDRQAQERALRSSAAFVHALLRPLDVEADPEQHVLRRRRARWLASAALLAALILLIGSALRAPNYAEEARWTTSSAVDGSPTHGVGFTALPLGPFFFHTELETNPWLEFDLGRERSISSIVVDNRPDCCAERALPLVAEVSTDHRHYTSVAECRDNFLTCKRRFPPTSARYVRLHVPTRTNLHLDHVEIR